MSFDVGAAGRSEGARLRVLPAGDRALLIETRDQASAHRLHTALRSAGPPGLVDVVPGARTVLVVADPARLDLDRLAAELPGWRLSESPAATTAPLEVPVAYDGEDLAEVASRTGLTPREVVERHTGSEHVVAFLGFSPGFGYLTGLDPALHVPRRSSPRTAVPAGSVAVAGAYSCVYPSATPGGWRLLGHTDLEIWDPARDPPALLQPGQRVRFVEAR